MKADNYQSLTSRLSVWIISSGTLVFIIVLGANYFLARNLLNNHIERLAKKAVQATVQKIDTVLHSVSTSANSLAALVTTPDISKNHIQQMTKAFVESNADIFGMTTALEAGVLSEPTTDFAPYFYKKNNKITYTDLASDSYRYKNWHWYRDAKKANAAVWSEPYIDKGGGNVHMVTYSTPIHFNNDKTFAGVATADIKLSWLDNIIRNSKINKSGYGFIVSNNDIIIAHPNKSLHMKPLKETGISNNNWHKYLNSKATSTANYFATPCSLPGGDCWVAIKTLSSSGWKVIIVIPEQALIKDVQQLTINIALIAIAGLVILLLVILYITGALTRPLAELASTTKNIGAGDLNVKIPAPVRNDEIGALTKDFSAMRDALKIHIQEIQRATAKQQKLESEIQIAKDIQMSMVPGAGNAFLEKNSFQLFALLRPAQSVGGDLYYFQQDQDNETLHFIIGDVSDKGIPAALFMAKTITLYTRALRDKLSPAQTFNMMNDILAQNNDACMFVTALCGNINLKTGSTIMANAGHMNPIIKNTKNTHEQDIKGATALGLMEGVNYSDITFQLSQKDSIIMYTDGISEAHDENNQQYSDEKLINLIATTNNSNIEETGNSIINSVDSFAGNAEQFDDITLLIIRYE